MSLLLLLLTNSVAIALEPDQIILVVNKNLPESEQLARFYCNARLIPTTHIVPLDLPTGEEMTLLAYERDLVFPLRKHLRDNGMEDRITCLVTFYGVPLRIAQRINTTTEKAEIQSITSERNKRLDELKELVIGIEKQASDASPAFKPGSGTDFDSLSKRADAALGLLARDLARRDDPNERAEQLALLVQTVQKLSGPAGVVRHFRAAGRTDEERAKATELVERIRKIAADIGQLQQRRNEPEARDRMRKLVREGFGMAEEIRVLQGHLDYLDAPQSVAAVDSELSLLWWNFYPLNKWNANPLHFRMPAAARSIGPRTLMVMRLDAPQSGQVREIILSSLKAEKQGLIGKLVLDSRAIMPKGRPDGGSYAWYDQTLRNLAELIRTRTKLQLLHEDSPELLTEGAADDVALYCGWYSHRQYKACCRLNMGAVGYHVASSELVSLRREGERGWVRGLINDGIAASLGPVAEPYLFAFPPADEFFPLLLTGELTLAEVYWKTTPVTSWMISMIGDPLYRPYKVKPVLKPEDLPPALINALKPETSAPATRPN